MIEIQQGESGVYEVFKYSIPVIIFIIGWAFTVFYDKSKKKSDAELYKQIIVDIIDLSILDIGQYIVILERLAEDIYSNETFDIIPYNTHEINLDVINSLNNESKIKVLLINTKCKDYSMHSGNVYNFLKQIEYLSQISKFINKNYDDYFNRVKELSNNLRKLMNQLKEDIYLGEEKDPNNKFYREMNLLYSLITQRQSEEGLSMRIDYYKKIFIDPAFLICKKFNNNNINNVFLILSSIKSIIEQMQSIKENAGLFRGCVDNIKKSTNKLKEINDYFRSKKIKSRWKIQ